MIKAFKKHTHKLSSNIMSKKIICDYKDKGMLNRLYNKGSITIGNVIKILYLKYHDNSI